jgi:hypothetical protein
VNRNNAVWLCALAWLVGTGCEAATSSVSPQTDVTSATDTGADDAADTALGLDADTANVTACNPACDPWQSCVGGVCGPQVLRGPLQSAEGQKKPVILCTSATRDNVPPINVPPMWTALATRSATRPCTCARRPSPVVSATQSVTTTTHAHRTIATNLARVAMRPSSVVALPIPIVTMAARARRTAVPPANAPSPAWRAAAKPTLTAVTAMSARPTPARAGPVSTPVSAAAAKPTSSVTTTPIGPLICANKTSASTRSAERRPLALATVIAAQTAASQPPVLAASAPTAAKPAAVAAPPTANVRQIPLVRCSLAVPCSAAARPRLAPLATFGTGLTIRANCHGYSVVPVRASSSICRL